MPVCNTKRVKLETVKALWCVKIYGKGCTDSEICHSFTDRSADGFPNKARTWTLHQIVKKGQTIHVVIDNLLCLYRKKALNQVYITRLVSRWQSYGVFLFKLELILHNFRSYLFYHCFTQTIFESTWSLCRLLLPFPFLTSLMMNMYNLTWTNT